MSDFSSSSNLRPDIKFASLFLRSTSNSQPILSTQMESANLNLIDIIANLTNQCNEGNPSSPMQKNINYEMLANIASMYNSINYPTGNTSPLNITQEIPSSLDAFNAYQNQQQTNQLQMQNLYTMLFFNMMNANSSNNTSYPNIFMNSPTLTTSQENHIDDVQKIVNLPPQSTNETSSNQMYLNFISQLSMMPNQILNQGNIPDILNNTKFSRNALSMAKHINGAENCSLTQKHVNSGKILNLENVNQNEAIVPSDDNEGWCRNKKYIQKVDSGYMCIVCKKIYGRYNSVSYHVTIYHRNPPIQCTEEGCSFSTREARYIHFHKYYRHGIPLPQSIDLESRKCPFCRHVSKSPAMLEKHIARHVPEGMKNGKKIKCPKCDEMFDKQKLLFDHIKTHENNNSIICVLCNMSFTSTPELDKHKVSVHICDTSCSEESVGSSPHCSSDEEGIFHGPGTPSSSSGKSPI
uniref:C2H2-type domain-containing protein n=1 Tax=Strongyloides papillosus TaxID=174720 RepID=A0A0N5BH94_STREA